MGEYRQRRADVGGAVYSAPNRVTRYVAKQDQKRPAPCVNRALAHWLGVEMRQNTSAIAAARLRLATAGDLLDRCRELIGSGDSHLAQQ